MKKTAIIVETSNGNFIVQVPNFSKENCIEGLKKVIKVDTDNIVQLSASTSYGIYGVKEIYPTAKELFISTSPFFYTNEYPLYFIVKYGFIYE
jgi:hypothetical protein